MSKLFPMERDNPWRHLEAAPIGSSIINHGSQVFLNIALSTPIWAGGVHLTQRTTIPPQLYGKPWGWIRVSSDRHWRATSYPVSIIVPILANKIIRCDRYKSMAEIIWNTPPCQRVKHNKCTSQVRSQVTISMYLYYNIPNTATSGAPTTSHLQYEQDVIFDWTFSNPTHHDLTWNYLNLTRINLRFKLGL